MNIVELAIERTGNQSRLSEKLTELTGHNYKQGHIQYWKKNGCFPAELAFVVAAEIFEHEFSVREICPQIKTVKRENAT